MMATQILSIPVVSSPVETVLNRVVQTDCALAVWQRSLPQALVKPLAELDLPSIDDLLLRLELPITPAALAANLVVNGCPEATAKALAADIASLARRLALASGALRVKVRLEIVETDACRKFHADFTTLRLITTYRGQGTQWHHVDRPEATEQLEAGEVAIFKGRLLMEDPTILHRSPPIAGTGEQRLLLAIDHDVDRKVQRDSLHIPRQFSPAG